MRRGSWTGVEFLPASVLTFDKTMTTSVVVVVFAGCATILRERGDKTLLFRMYLNLLRVPSAGGEFVIVEKRCHPGVLKKGAEGGLFFFNIGRWGKLPRRKRRKNDTQAILSLPRDVGRWHIYTSTCSRIYSGRPQAGDG